MCKACSMLITKSNKVYWKVGVDSHDDLIKLYEKTDNDLDTNVKPLKFAKIEISPKNDNYLDIKKSNWGFKVDEEVRPEFILPLQEKLCWKAWAKWKKEVYSKIDLKIAKKPINPIKIKHSTKVSEKEMSLVIEWASVWDSVRASVWDSVWDSVWAFMGSLFKLPRIEWKYTEEIRTEDYPFQPAVDLWKRGLVPSYDGKKWRLHQMCNKAKIIWKGEIKGGKLI